MSEDNKRRRSYRDINEKYQFKSDRDTERMSNRQTSKRPSGENYSNRGTNNRKRRVTREEAERNRKEIRRQRQGYRHDEDLGKTMVLRPEMVERERKRIIEQKRAKKKAELRRRRLIALLVSIIAIVLIVWGIRKLRGLSDKPKENPKQTTSQTENANQKEAVKTMALVKFVSTNKMTNLYEKADMTSNVLEQVPVDTYLQYFGQAGDFAQVKLSDKVGYVLSSDISDIEEGNNFKVINGILLVNADYGLPEDYDPGVDRDAQRAFNLMVDDASKQNVVIRNINDYLSYEQQARLDDTEDVKFAEPGHSEHQTGLAYDLMGEDYSLKYKKDFAKSPEYKWLLDNSYKYGFIARYPENKETVTGVDFQPWQFRYVGVEAATLIHNQNTTLEEYLNSPVQAQTDAKRNQENNNNQESAGNQENREEDTDKDNTNTDQTNDEDIDQNRQDNNQNTSEQNGQDEDNQNENNQDRNREDTDKQDRTSSNEEDEEENNSSN